jgi:hypothetical protein
MASDAQIRANRANAQKSTGPRTEAGKDRSRLNATRHGITGTLSLRSGPEAAAFDAYFQRLLPSFEVRTPLESELAARAIDVLFRLARLSVVEGNIFAAGLHEIPANPGVTSSAEPPSDVDRALAQTKTLLRESRTFSNLSLYEQRLSRTLRNDLDMLQRLRNPKQSLQAVPAPPRYTGVRWVSDGDDSVESKPSDRFGFVFPTPQRDSSPPGIAA